MRRYISSWFHSVFFWLAIAVIGLAGAALFYFNYGGTSGPVTTNDQILKTVNASMTKGDAHAPVKMVEYADFLCPYCSKFAYNVMPSIERDYINTGKVRLEFRPVAVIAPDSQRAAEGAYCAAEQNKFWDYYQTAYDTTWSKYYAKGAKPEQVPSFHLSAIEGIAESAGLDVHAFSICVNDGRYTDTVKQATDAFQKNSWHGTPTFFINNEQYIGYVSYDVAKPVIDSFIKK